MTVKNEAANNLDCLSPIVDLFAEIVVIDTDSTDGTTRLLSDVLAIEPCCQDLTENPDRRTSPSWTLMIGISAWIGILTQPLSNILLVSLPSP